MVHILQIYTVEEGSMWEAWLMILEKVRIHSEQDSNWYSGIALFQLFS